VREWLAPPYPSPVGVGLGEDDATVLDEHIPVTLSSLLQPPEDPATFVGQPSDAQRLEIVGRKRTLLSRSTWEGTVVWSTTTVAALGALAARSSTRSPRRIVSGWRFAVAMAPRSRSIRLARDEALLEQVEAELRDYEDWGARPSCEPEHGCRS